MTELQFSVKPLPPNPDIVLITVDGDSAQTLQKESPIGPLDRRIYGRLISKLAHAKVSVFLSDIIFLADVPEQDEEFFNAIKQTGQMGSMAMIFTVADIDAQPNPESMDGYDYEFAFNPRFADLQVDLGMALAFAPDEQVIGCLPFKRDMYSNERYPHTALLATWRHLRLDPADASLTNRRLTLPSWEADLGFNKELPLVWTSEARAFPELSLTEALAKLEKEPTVFKDKIVLLGDIRSDTDQVQVPRQGTVRGVYVLANLINSALSPPSQRVHWFDSKSHHVWITIVAWICGVAVFMRKTWLVLIAIAAPLLIGLLVPWVMATNFRIILPVIWPILSLGLTIGTGLLILVIQSPELDTRAAGNLSEATILFADLTQSTEHVQAVGALEYQEQFSHWCKMCEEVIRRKGGSIERTTGDGFIAVFPHQLIQSSHECLAACESILDKTAPGLTPTFGFESGPVSGGYVTEAGRNVWSSTGITVNMAKRIQSLSSQLGHAIVFGPIAARSISERQKVTSLGNRKLKGIQGKTECFILTKSKSD